MRPRQMHSTQVNSFAGHARTREHYYSIVCGNEFKGGDLKSPTSKPRTTSLMMQALKTCTDEGAAQDGSSWPPCIEISRYNDIPARGQTTDSFNNNRRSAPQGIWECIRRGRHRGGCRCRCRGIVDVEGLSMFNFAGETNFLVDLRSGSR